ncbi:unnamed protein product [Thlaspi arvense]|uniref:Peptidylprolyl isomerase n=1 Tax=Thlaspi arvense TaxID=13288 RepID=A0AAU9SGX1_THLAR|nr:unnamed protein product [Thlaspi arvense]
MYKKSWGIKHGILQESPEGEGAMVTILSTPLSPRLTFLCEKLSLSLSQGISQSRSKRSICCSLSEEPNCQSLSRRNLVYVLVSSPCLFTASPSSAKAKSKSPYDERRLLEQNKRIQRENNAPDEFPNFVREGFEVKVVASDNYIKADSGLIYRDFDVGEGDCPKDGQQVTFHYIGYNESGRRIDRFEMGIRDMKPGGRRRIIIPPELGPPVGPSTFFSSKQFEVFDVELLSIQNCQRRTIGFYSDALSYEIHGEPSKMSSLRNAVPRPAHKERSQPQARKKFGLLEKHKDYVIRAKAYHQKENIKKKLRQKAAFKNPDEFYFNMINSETDRGVHKRKEEVNKYNAEELLIMKTQDIGYVFQKWQSEKNKIDKLTASLQCTEALPSRRHVYYAEDRANDLEKLYMDMSMQKELQKKGRKRKLREDEILNPNGKPVYKWKADRKR